MTLSTEYRAIVKKAGEAPSIVWSTLDLKALQGHVGGLIEYAYTEELPKGLCIVCYEESKLYEQAANIVLKHEGKIYDFIAGDIIIYSEDNEQNPMSMSMEEMFKVMVALDKLDVKHYTQRRA